MTSFTTVSGASLSPGKPLTSSIATAWNDNPVAIAEGDDTAPVLAHAWHPYNKLINGDANDGVFYDAAVNGAVANLVTPNFEDGYEYRVILARFGHSDGNPQNVQIEIYGQIMSAYETPAIVLSSAVAPSSGRQSAIIEFPFARRIQRDQVYDVHGGSPPQSGIVRWNGASDSILKARITFTAGNINNGTAVLQRRKAF